MIRSLLILFLFSFAGAQAQGHKGLFFVPGIGISSGWFTPKTATYNTSNISQQWSYKDGRGFKYGFDLGYERPRWAVNMGVVSLYQWSSATFHQVYSPIIGPAVINGSETIRMRYVLYPLCVSYRQKIKAKGKPVWLVPSVGVELGRNVVRSEKGTQDIILTSISGTDSSSSTSFTHTMKKKDLDFQNHRTNTWLVARIELENIGRSFTIGPEYHLMTAPLSKLDGQGARSSVFILNFGYKLVRD